jgi:hypothetical protein
VLLAKSAHERAPRRFSRRQLVQVVTSQLYDFHKTRAREGIEAREAAYAVATSR